MLLKAYKTYNDPGTIAEYFLETVCQHQGCPKTLKGYFGTVNVIMRDISAIFPLEMKAMAIKAPRKEQVH